MSQDDRDEQLLERARRALSPTAADAERVFDATRRAISGAAAGAAAVHVLSRATKPRSSASAALHGYAARALTALAIAGTSAGTGYYAGYRAGRADAPAAAPAAHAPSAVALAPRVIETPPAAASAAPPAASAETPNGVPRTSARSSAQRADAAVAPSGAQSLEREVQMMKRIERALREGNPQQALVLLGQLDREIPGGQLAEERLAVFALARCGLGLGSPAAIAREFAQRYPKSVYFARVRRACAAGEDPPVPLD
jgi:hypothetical protein